MGGQDHGSHWEAGSRQVSWSLVIDLEKRPDLCQLAM